MNIQINHITRNAYQGKNQAELMSAKEEFGYISDEWLTFVQARTNGLKIRKGSKGVVIFKGFGEIVVKEKKNGKEIEKSDYKPNGFARVFNLDQTEKFDEKN